MKIIIEGNLKNEIPEFYIQTFSLLFFPEDNIFGKNNISENYIKIFADKEKKDKYIIDISVNICYNKKTALKKASLSEEGVVRSAALGVENSPNQDIIINIGKLFYETAGEITGIYPPWGIHTGIRPAKTAGNLLENNNFDEIKTLEILCEDYLMNKNKAALAIETYKNGKNAISLSEGGVGKADWGRKKDFSLYISIPFCPTRCRYCSFVSFATPGLLKLIPEYIKKLIEEIEYISKITKDLNMRLKTIYIGGGTPTTPDCEYLENILNAVKNNFDLSNLLEYTAECGRADTITENKLELLKKFGIDRISINPQTLNNDILNKIGRNHTAEDFLCAFETARKVGIKNINTDCIIGLPDESESSMINTIEKLAGLKPENITIHSLCLKKSSDLKNELKSDKVYISNAPELNSVLENGYNILKSEGYKPYYMYRQKYAVGNLENTGFCLDGCECLYNIYMMDEIQTIFGVGAGAMTKLVKNGRIERIANYKYPYEYIGHDFQINKESNREKLGMLN